MNNNLGVLGWGFRTHKPDKRTRSSYKREALGRTYTYGPSNQVILNRREKENKQEE